MLVYHPQWTNKFIPTINVIDVCFTPEVRFAFYYPLGRVLCLRFTWIISVIFITSALCSHMLIHSSRWTVVQKTKNGYIFAETFPICDVKSALLSPSAGRKPSNGSHELGLEMEDGPGSHHVQYGSNSAVMSIGANKQPEDQATRQQYSMPGILHFLQTEWARFEMERSQWEVERAELQVNFVYFCLSGRHRVVSLRCIRWHLNCMSYDHNIRLDGLFYCVSVSVLVSMFEKWQHRHLEFQYGGGLFE